MEGRLNWGGGGGGFTSEEVFFKAPDAPDYIMGIIKGLHVKVSSSIFFFSQEPYWVGLCI